MATKLFAKIILLALGIAVALAIGEAGLRIKRQVSANYILRYDGQTGLLTMKPNDVFADGQAGCWENKAVKANSQGFHDTEFSLTKDRDVYRIAVIGDSFIEAFQVPVADSFQYWLEEKLNQWPEKKKRFEVYSFGNGGTGTFEHHLYLNQYVLKYQPDLVILAFLPMNDFKDDFRLRKEIFDRQGEIRKEVPLAQRWLRHSVLFRWFKAKWQIIDSFAAAEGKVKLLFDWQAFLKDYPPAWEGIWQLEKKLLAQFDKTLEENKSQFLLVSLDDMWRTHPKQIEKDKELYSLDKFDFDFDKPEKILQEFSEKEKIPYLALLPIFRERAEKEKANIFWGGCQGHWDKTGHRWVAETLFQFLTQEENKRLISD